MGAKITNETFPVLGMSCAACATRVEKTLNGQKGVVKAAVNYAAATAKVEYDAAECSPEALKAAVQDAGYDLLTLTGERAATEAEKAHGERYAQLRRRTIWAIALALPTAVIGMFFMDMPYADVIMWALATPVVFWLGRDFHVNAWKQLKHRTANMDTLVACSTGSAYLFSVFNMLFPDFWHYETDLDLSEWLLLALEIVTIWPLTTITFGLFSIRLPKLNKRRTEQKS